MYGIILGHLAALETYRASHIRWTVLTPPMHIQGWTLGAPPQPHRTGKYRVSTTELVSDAHGQSAIDVADLAVAAVDEAEHPRFIGKRFTVGYWRYERSAEAPGRTGPSTTSCLNVRFRRKAEWPRLTQSRWGGWLLLTASECLGVEAIKQPRVPSENLIHRIRNGEGNRDMIVTDGEPGKTSVGICLELLPIA
jgi:hypothetical protein